MKVDQWSKYGHGNVEEKNTEFKKTENSFVDSNLYKQNIIHCKVGSSVKKIELIF